MAKETRTLIRWGLVSQNNTGPYLAGLQSNLVTRTSTPLVEFDPVEATALTASGRPYVLAGQCDLEYGLAIAKEVWGQYFDVSETTIVALSPDEALALMSGRDNQPLPLEEQRAFGKKYGIPVSLADEVEAFPDPSDLMDTDDVVITATVHKAYKADLTLSILESIRQRGLSAEEAVEVTGIDVERMLALIERRNSSAMSANDLKHILDSIDRLPKYGGKP